MTKYVSKALVLLSGGQDSTTCLYWAKEQRAADGSPRYAEIHAVTLHYGQRHVSEIGAAAMIAGLAGVASHRVFDVPVLMASPSALVDVTKPIAASGGYVDAEAPGGLPTSFVPGRNLVFLAMAASYAASLGCDTIVTGVCQADYSGYPDCRASFVQAMAEAIGEAMPSGMPPMSIATPLMDQSKADSIRMAAQLPGCLEALAHSVTCYHGQRPGCGSCPACVVRARGFAEAGIADPAVA